MKKRNRLILSFLFIVMLGVTVLVCPQRCAKAMSAEDLFVNFTSDSYLVMDPNSNTILYGKNVEQKLPVASICKLMTTLITLEKIDRGELSLDDKLLASEYASSVEGSQAFLDAGSEYTVSDLLKSVIVASANDSAVVLAESIGGSEENFVRLMNSRAKELGMKNTVYSNSTGLPKSNQYSTALDTAILLNKVSSYDIYEGYCGIWMDKLIHPSGRETELVNTNRLIKYYENCKCGKTGFTDEAGYCLSAVSKKGDMKLIAVALKCDSSVDRFKECMELFNYGFTNFENKLIIDNNVTLTQIMPVKGGEKDNVELIAKNDFYIINKRGDNNEIEFRYELLDEVKAPAKAGDCVGKIVILKKGVVVGEVEVVLKDSVEKQTYSDILEKIYKNWKF